MILRKSRRELERMAAAGSIVARTLALLRERARPGVTTGELDRAAEEFIRGQGGVPTFKGYHGFPASICASPNDMVVHGIPGAYALREGDVLSVDVGVTLRGWVADSGYTFWVGEGDPPEDVRAPARRPAARRSSPRVEQCVDGDHLSDLGHAVQTRVEADGFGVIRSLVGHGVGRRMHEDPQIPNYGPPGRGPRAAPGHDAGRRADDHRQRRDGRAARRGRRLVDLQRRPLAHGALRAHGRRDRRRAARS